MLKYNARECLTSRACKLASITLSLVRPVPLVQPHLLSWYLIKNTYNLFLTQQKYCFRKELQRLKKELSGNQKFSFDVSFIAEFVFAGIFRSIYSFVTIILQNERSKTKKKVIIGIP